VDKPGPLSAEEFGVLARHPVMGDEILSAIGHWDDVARLVRHHHERVDGKGYPDGLMGPSIPEGARILCVADCFDSMISNRSYRRPLGVDEALGQLRRGAGTQFDALFVATFVQLISERWEQRATRLGASTLLAEISMRDHEEAVRFASRKYPRASLGGLASMLQLDFPDLTLEQAQKVVISVLAPDRLPDDLISDDTERIKDDEVCVRYPARIDGDVSSVVLFERRLYCIVRIHELDDGRFEYHLKR